MIRCVTQIGEGGIVTTTMLISPEVLDRINGAEGQFGEQRGAEIRDKLLTALAAMVIQSIDEFRAGPIFTSAADDRRIEADRQRILKSGQKPEIGTGEEPLDFGGRVK